MSRSPAAPKGFTFLRRPAGSVLAGLRVVRGSGPRLLLQDLPNADTPVMKPTGPDDPEAQSEQDRYQVLGEIARGGVGIVVKGHDADLGRDVAMKLLREEHATDRGILHRFVEEAQIDAQLQHPGIVPVYDLGLLTSKRPFFAMKLVKGRTLGAILRRRGDPAEGLTDVLRVFEAVCQTVAYAHDRGVVHRDLKPGNVMVGAFGEVHVVDWGLAKILNRDEATDVRTVRTESEGVGSTSGTILGTPSTMAPEQARGEVEAIDERTDVFALGAILCEILTGAGPYPNDPGRALAAAAASDLDDAYDRLASSSGPESLTALARACLARDPVVRPAHAGEVAEAVAAWHVSAEEREHAAAIARAEAEAQAVADRRARKLTLGLAGGILAILLMAGGVWLARERRLATEALATRERVAEALATAQRHRGAAQAAAVENAAAWERTLRSVEAAETVLHAGTPDEETTLWVAAVRTDVEREAAAAAEQAKRIARDRETTTRLETLRFDADRNAGDWAEEVAEALSAHGLDLASLEADEAARRIREGRIAPALIEALDDLALTTGAYDDATAPDTWRAVEIVLLADTEPTRQRVRRATRAGDASALLELADEADDALLPTMAGEILAHALATYAAPEDEAEFLAWAIRRRPDTPALQRRLAARHLAEDPPRAHRAIAHLRATLALRPRSVRALALLEQAQAQNEKVAGDER